MAHLSALAKFVSLIVFLAVLYLFVVLMSFILPSQRILNDAGEIVQGDLWLWSAYATLGVLAFLLVLGLVSAPLAAIGVKDAKERVASRWYRPSAVQRGSPMMRGSVPSCARA